MKDGGIYLVSTNEKLDARVRRRNTSHMALATPCSCKEVLQGGTKTDRIIIELQPHFLDNKTFWRIPPLRQSTLHYIFLMLSGKFVYSSRRHPIVTYTSCSLRPAVGENTSETPQAHRTKQILPYAGLATPWIDCPYWRNAKWGYASSRSQKYHGITLSRRKHSSLLVPVHVSFYKRSWI